MIVSSPSPEGSKQRSCTGGLWLCGGEGGLAAWLAAWEDPRAAASDIWVLSCDAALSWDLSGDGSGLGPLGSEYQRGQRAGRWVRVAEVFVGGRRGGEACGGHRSTVGVALLLEGKAGGFRLGVETVRASLPVVWPLLDDIVEPVAWRERLLHIPVSFDLIVGKQSSLSHSASQQTLGRPDGPGMGRPLCGGRGRI